MSSRPGVLIDRDGVINELVVDASTGEGESPLRSDEVHLVADASRHLRRLATAGFLVACVTNQPAAAKGVLSVEEVVAIQDQVLSALAHGGFVFDAVRTCLHHPEGRVASLRGPCACRKPAPGMLFSVAKELDIDLPESWMIGDTDGDVLAGQAAGARTILVTTPASVHKRSGRVRPDVVVADLAEAVGVVVGSLAPDVDCPK